MDRLAVAVAAERLPELGRILFSTFRGSRSRESEIEWFHNQLYAEAPYDDALSDLGGARYDLFMSAWPCGFDRVLFSGSDGDIQNSTSLMYAYLEAASKVNVSVVTHFGSFPEEMREVLINRFVGFIRVWRRRVVAKLADAILQSVSTDEVEREYQRLLRAPVGSAIQAKIDAKRPRSERLSGLLLLTFCRYFGHKLTGGSIKCEDESESEYCPRCKRLVILRTAPKFLIFKKQQCGQAHYVLHKQSRETGEISERMIESPKD